MLRKCLLLLAAAVLLFTLAGAETAEDATPAENPFIGAWQAAYYIQDGKLLTEENATIIEFAADYLTVHYSEDDKNQADCIYEGNTCSAWSGHTTFVMEGENLIVGSEEGLSFILTRIDPMLLNNPFIGTWEILFYTEDGTVRDIEEYAIYTGAAVPAAGELVMPVTFNGDTILIDSRAYPCTYADGVCNVFDDDTLTAFCTITEDGVLHIVNPEDTTMSFICVREDEVVPENITQFFGAWREIAALRGGLLITDQMPQYQRPFENNLLFRYDFSRAAVRRSCPEHADDPSAWILCTYADDTCTILYDDGPVLCTIDENGLMCMRSEDGDAIWLVRVQEAPAAEEPAADE